MRSEGGPARFPTPTVRRDDNTGMRSLGAAVVGPRGAVRPRPRGSPVSGNGGGSGSQAAATDWVWDAAANPAARHAARPNAVWGGGGQGSALLTPPTPQPAQRRAAAASAGASEPRPGPWPLRADPSGQSRAHTPRAVCRPRDSANPRPSCLARAWWVGPASMCRRRTHTPLRPIPSGGGMRRRRTRRPRSRSCRGRGRRLGLRGLRLRQPQREPWEELDDICKSLDDAVTLKELSGLCCRGAN